MLRILSVSRNVGLLISRNDALAIAGFSVISPKTVEEAPLLAAQRKIDAMIVGHSVEPERREPLIAEMRRLFPECLIVFVYAFPDTTGEPLADVSIDVTRGPEPLVTALKERLQPVEAAD